MFIALFSTFLLFMPGLIAAEILSSLKNEAHHDNLSYLFNVLVFSFLILGANVVVKTLLGAGDQIFMLMVNQISTISLVKYIGLSLVFALLLPHVYLLIVLILKNWAKKNHV